jgi:hypothetical protein
MAMRRISLLGVALLVLLGAGCFGGSAGNSNPPSDGAVAVVVKRMVKGNAQAKCTLVGLRVKCGVAVLPTGGFSGAIGIDRVWFNLRPVNGGWRVEPDCTSNPHDVLCLQLLQASRTVNTVIPR